MVTNYKLRFPDLAYRKNHRIYRFAWETVYFLAEYDLETIYYYQFNKFTAEEKHKTPYHRNLAFAHTISEV